MLTAQGFVGKKCGMTRFFNESGVSIPVTIFEVQPHYVMAKKEYGAIQLATVTVKPTKLSKPEKGIFTKLSVEPKKILQEFKIDPSELVNYELGQEINIEAFTEVTKVDVTSVSKGKGFAGVIKRHNFRSGRASHGNSKSHNKPGSIGQRQDPGKVFKGKKMAGHMGNKKVTVQNLKLVKIDSANNILAIQGSVPGAIGTMVTIKPAIKAKKAKKNR